MPDFRRVLVLAPHADDEVLGCGGLLARLRDENAAVRVLFMSVDGMHHAGLDRRAGFAERVAEIEAVRGILGFEYSIAYPDKDMCERLDTVPRRELVDLIQSAADEFEPDLLLLPSGHDYDQDHVATFAAGFAAARPIARQFGRWLVPHVFSYEITKIQWSAEPLPRAAAFVDITDQLDTKLAALQAYATQHRAVPHIRSEEAVRGLACLRGAEIGVHYAEAFEVHRTTL
ncbi:PIG-L deacetylase family protein [Micromonospora sp. L5]|uniref:PIG-L deacetylase family protein n=1 Tax=Micromonospora TaxID=1873 RepID=UPI0001C45C84|nr:PIG-L deacetylase family protein [Micromonospora sp. L5]